uniref:Uncharacterized protein n=1 Tax=Strongyloides venezuelensis TaxID=75913 RepID=A0A0K0G639_STRVS
MLDISGIPINNAIKLNLFKKSTNISRKNNYIFKSSTFSWEGGIIYTIKSEEKKILSNDSRQKKVQIFLKYDGSIQDSTFQTGTKEVQLLIICLRKLTDLKFIVYIYVLMDQSKILNNNVIIKDIPKAREIRSAIDNIILINPVPQKSTSFEQ